MVPGGSCLVRLRGWEVEKSREGVPFKVSSTEHIMGRWLYALRIDMHHLTQRTIPANSDPHATGRGRRDRPQSTGARKLKISTGGKEQESREGQPFHSTWGLWDE